MEDQTFGATVKIARTRAHLSQHQLSVLLDVSSSTICRWEQGSSAPIERAVVERLAAFFRLDQPALWSQAQTQTAELASARFGDVISVSTTQPTTEDMQWQEFGAALRHYRKAAGLTQDQLGAQIGWSGGSISHWEKETRVPRPCVLDLLADALDVNRIVFGRFLSKAADATQLDLSEPDEDDDVGEFRDALPIEDDEDVGDGPLTAFVEAINADRSLVSITHFPTGIGIILPTEQAAALTRLPPALQATWLRAIVATIDATVSAGRWYAEDIK